MPSEHTGDGTDRSATLVDGAYVLTNDGQVALCLSSKLNEFEPDDADRLADVIREKANEARGGGDGAE